MMKWVTTTAFLVLTGGLATMIWQVSAKNAEFDQMKKDQIELHAKVERYNKLEGLIIDMAIDVCELRANGNAQAIVQCQQIRQSFNR